MPQLLTCSNTGQWRGMLEGLEVLNVKALCKTLLLFSHLFRYWWRWIYPNSIVEIVDPHWEVLFSGTPWCLSYGNGIPTQSCECWFERQRGDREWCKLLVVICIFHHIFTFLPCAFLTLWNVKHIERLTPSHTEYVHSWTALVLMSKERAGVIKDWT